MRILQLIDTLNAGGAERVAVNYANMLAKELNGSYLATSRESGVLEEELDDRVVYINLSKTSTFDLSAIIRFKKFLKSNNINIIHAHTTSYFFAVLTKFFYRKIKVIWHDHQGNRDELKVMKQIPLVISSFFFNGVMVVNSRLESWVKKYLQTRNVIYIENFVSESAKRTGVTKLFGDDGKRIISVANLKAPKNHLFLLKAFNEVRKKNTDWSLHLVGSDYQDSYSERLKRYIKQYELEESVFIYDLRKDMDTILEQSSIGVIASSFEGLPMALLEYGKAGLAIITTDVGSCKDLIENRGVVIESDNEEQLINAMNLLIEDQVLRKKSADEIKKYIDSYFTERTVLSKVMKFYNLIYKE